MAKQERPPRSLRGGDSGPRYYRDWAAADAVISQGDYELGDAGEEGDAPLQAQEMQMLESLNEPEPKPSHGRPGPVYAELAPLSVITPTEEPHSPANAEPEGKPKVQITRVNRPSIQRARRYNELQAEEDKKQREAAAEAARKQAEVPPEMPSRTRGLAAGSGRTTELKTNIKDISEKIDETAENVKSTADSITQNIREMGDKLSASVVGSVKKVSNHMVGLINRWGKKSESAASSDDQDFEDEPLPTQTASPPPVPVASDNQTATTAFGEKAQAAAHNMLDQVPTVPPLPISPFLKEGVQFVTFDKKPLPSETSPQESELKNRFLTEAMADVRNCIKLVRKLPDPKEGPYKGIPLAYIFQNIREQDIYFFLHYVQAHPAAFKDKEFKFAEAFASWVLKRSHKTVIADPFPEVLPLAYFPLYKQNIRFLTLAKKSMVLATGKSPDEVNRLFIEAAIEDVKACVEFVAQFPPPEQGPYKGRPMRQIFRNISERDIYFFLHYVQGQPEIFQNQNFKFSEAFASWLLKRSHETQLPLV